MLTISQMIMRLLVALALGGIMGLERELVGKEAGIRTAMLVASGAAIFAIIGITLPALITSSPDAILDISAHNAGALNVIANIVIGIGFLGAGLIIKTGEHVQGLTSAAVIWTTAALGTLAGIGLTQFSFYATVIIASMLYLLRKTKISGHVTETIRAQIEEDIRKDIVKVSRIKK